MTQTKKKLDPLIGVMITSLLMIIALSNGPNPLDSHAYKLTLTSDGCGYAQSIGMRVDKNGECSVVARFHPSMFRGGGVLRLDDDRTIDVTGAMILASATSDVDLPLTAAQQKARHWFWAWLAMAAVAGIGTLLSCFVTREEVE
jgi:hypothetical protein